MKNSVVLIQQRMAAICGKLILTLYSAYSSLFIKKEGFTPPYQPISQQEIILIRKTGKVYNKVAKQYSIS
jgi:hypothetical protein